MLEVDGKYGGHRETDASDPVRTFRGRLADNIGRNDCR